MKSEKYSTIEIVEAGLLASMTAIVYFIIGLFASLPIVFVVLKHSFRAGVLCSIVATILIYLFSGYLQALIFFTVFVSNGLTMAYFIKISKINAFTNIILTTLVSFLFCILAVLILVNVFNFNIIEILNNQVEVSKNTTIGLFEKFNLNKSDLDVADVVETQLNFLKKIFPSLIYSVIFINTFLTYFLLQYVCKRFNIKLKYLEKFIRFKVDDKFIWGIIFVLGIIIFLNNFYWLNLTAYNIGIVLFVFYFIQGIAVIKFWFLKYRIHPIVQLIIMFFVLFGGLVFFVGFIGLIDTWFDFRKLQSPVVKD